MRQAPVRWSAIEVLQANKYSKASVSPPIIYPRSFKPHLRRVHSETSTHPHDLRAQQDVWAYGVLVFETLGRGAHPYGASANLADVAEQIKAGKLLQCPSGCRKEIYDDVMVPCWAHDPSARPGFHELCDVLVRLGATPAVEMAVPTAEVTIAFEEETQTDREWKSGLRDRSLLGVSVAHVIHLAQRVVTAVASPWTDRRGIAVEPPKSATILHMVLAVAKPASAETVCPRDGKLGCAYVDTLSGRSNVGKATALLSCEPPRP